MPTIRTSIEGPRGCGYRKGGGIYLVSPGFGRPCGKFPAPLDVCPTCGHGIRPARGWAWIDPRPIFAAVPCDRASAPEFEAFTCRDCPAALDAMGERAGLLWIGEKFYPTVADFTAEAARMGVSRRIAQVPRDLVVGETWILLAHRRGKARPCEACGATGRRLVASSDFVNPADLLLPPPNVGEERECEECDGSGVRWIPAVFKAFRPIALEYVVRGTETEAELTRLEARGFSLVRVVKSPDGTAPLLEWGDDDEEE